MLPLPALRLTNQQIMSEARGMLNLCGHITHKDNDLVRRTAVEDPLFTAVPDDDMRVLLFQWDKGIPLVVHAPFIDVNQITAHGRMRR